MTDSHFLNDLNDLDLNDQKRHIINSIPISILPILILQM